MLVAIVSWVDVQFASVHNAILLSPSIILFLFSPIIHWGFAAFFDNIFIFLVIGSLVELWPEPTPPRTRMIRYTLCYSIGLLTSGYFWWLRNWAFLKVTLGLSAMTCAQIAVLLIQLVLFHKKLNWKPVNYFASATVGFGLAYYLAPFLEINQWVSITKDSSPALHAIAFFLGLVIGFPLLHRGLPRNFQRNS